MIPDRPAVSKPPCAGRRRVVKSFVVPALTGPAATWPTGGTTTDRSAFAALIVTWRTAVIAGRLGGTSLSLRRAWLRGFHALRRPCKHGARRDVPPDARRLLAACHVTIKAAFAKTALVRFDARGNNAALTRRLPPRKVSQNEKEFVAHRDACLSRPQDQDDRTGGLLAAAQ